MALSGFKVGDTTYKLGASGIDSASATSGQVLTADGSGGASFQNAGGGGTTLNKYTYSSGGYTTDYSMLYKICKNAKSINITYLTFGYLGSYKIPVVIGAENEGTLNITGTTMTTSSIFGITMRINYSYSASNFKMYELSNGTITTTELYALYDIYITYWNDTEIQ